MATARPILDTRYKGKDNTFPVIVRLRHLTQVRDLATTWKIEEKYWKGSEVSAKHPDATVINHRISELIAQAKNYYAQCQLQGRKIDLKLFGTGRQTHSFIGYLKAREAHYRDKQMVIMYRKVARLSKELTTCFGREMYFEDITGEALRKYDSYLVTAENNETTRHKKFKMLREFYETAISEGLALAPNPFRNYKINVLPVKKEKLSLAEFKALEDLKLKPGALKLARDLFLFSYYAKGARFENCVTLRRDEVRDGRINFRTNKGKKYLSVKIHDRLQVLLDQYKAGKFVFPYIVEVKTDPEEYVAQIGTLNATVNRNLKKAAAFAGIEKPVSFHIARHTFAFHLKHTSDNIHVIKDALGHSDTRTTEIYLDNLDDEVLDKEMDKLYGK